MMLPLLPAEGTGLLLALVIGVAFGWGLETAGLGSARKLVGQFYGRDLTVLKVLFSAIVTTLLGVFWLDRAGLLDVSRVYLPETFLLPQAVGGLVFGIGMVLGGLCPGTACVAAASGRLDGLAVIAGMLIGVTLFAGAFPWIAGFYESTPRGAVTLPELLHLPRGVVVAGVVAMALSAFAAAERIERGAR
jgi:uncharacterized protein